VRCKNGRLISSRKLPDGEMGKKKKEKSSRGRRGVIFIPYGQVNIQRHESINTLPR
jgi:hypothetical protein